MNIQEILQILQLVESIINALSNMGVKVQGNPIDLVQVLKNLGLHQ